MSTDCPLALPKDRKRINPVGLHLRKSAHWMAAAVALFICGTGAYAWEPADGRTTVAQQNSVKESLDIILAEVFPAESINHDVLDGAARILIEDGSADVVPALLDFVESTTDEQNAPRRAALKVISAVGGLDVVPLLMSEYETLRFGWEIPVDGLRRLAPGRFGDKLLEEMEAGREIHKNATALVLLGDRSRIPDVIALLQHPNLEVRSYAARILYWMPDERAIPALRQALLLPRAEDFNTRAWAAHALHYLGIDEGLSVLIRDLQEVPVEINPNSTGRAIATIAGEQALDLYRPLLRDPEPVVRRNALLAMVWLVDNTDYSAPRNVREQRANDVAPLSSREEFLNLCYPLISDESADVSSQARSTFMVGMRAASRQSPGDRQLALSVARALWEDLFSDVRRQEELLDGHVFIVPPRPARFTFVGDFERPDLFVLCSHGQNPIVETSPTVAQEVDKARRPMGVAVHDIFRSKSFLMATAWLPRGEILTLLLQHTESGWKLARLLQHSEICIQ